MITSLNASTVRRSAVLMLIFLAISWLGEYVHNLFELPTLTALSPENSLPALVSLALFAAWWLTRFNRALTLLILAWGTLHLIGGAILSVIPFPFLPFYPEQTLSHYAAHIGYGLAQLPLIILAIRQLRNRQIGH
jgi:hypothetical protein